MLHALQVTGALIESVPDWRQLQFELERVGQYVIPQGALHYSIHTITPYSATLRASWSGPAMPAILPAVSRVYPRAKFDLGRTSSGEPDLPMTRETFMNGADIRKMIADAGND